MPDRHPMPRHDPPTVTDRILAHPEISLAASSVMAGLILFAVALDVLVTNNLSRLPETLLLIMGVFQLLGGLAVAAGLLVPFRRRDRAWLIESAGWWPVTAAWLAYAVVALAFGARTPASLIGPALGVCFASGGIIRLVALHWVQKVAEAEKAAQQLVEEYTRDDG